MYQSRAGICCATWAQTRRNVFKTRFGCHKNLQTSEELRATRMELDVDMRSIVVGKRPLESLIGRLWRVQRINFWHKRDRLRRRRHWRSDRIDGSARRSGQSTHGRWHGMKCSTNQRRWYRRNKSIKNGTQNPSHVDGEKRHQQRWQRTCGSAKSISRAWDQMGRVWQLSCKYSQLHTSNKCLLSHPSGHVERECMEHMISRLQVHQQPHTTRADVLPHTESPWTLWHTGGTRQRHPRHTSAQTGKALGGPQQLPRRRPQTNDNQQVSRLTCFQRNQVLTHLEFYTVAELVPETGICGEMLSNSMNRVEVETSRIIKKINMGNGTITREFFTHEKINQQTEYITNPQKQYTDKVVDLIVATQKQILQVQTMHRKSRTRKPKSSLDFRYSERAHWCSVKDTRNESSLRKVHGRKSDASFSQR